MQTPQAQPAPTSTEPPRRIPTLPELHAILEESKCRSAENEIYLRDLGKRLDQYEREVMGSQG